MFANLENPRELARTCPNLREIGKKPARTCEKFAKFVEFLEVPICQKRKITQFVAGRVFVPNFLQVGVSRISETEFHKCVLQGSLAPRTVPVLCWGAFNSQFAVMTGHGFDCVTGLPLSGNHMCAGGCFRQPVLTITSNVRGVCVYVCVVLRLELVLLCKHISHSK